MSNDTHAAPEWWPVDGEIQALDLVRIAADAKHHEGIDLESTRFRTSDGGGVYDAVYSPADGRAGVSLGAGAVWTDATSLADGIERVLSGDVIR